MFYVGSSSFECDQPVLLQRTGMAGQTADQWSKYFDHTGSNRHGRSVLTTYIIRLQRGSSATGNVGACKVLQSLAAASITWPTHALRFVSTSTPISGRPREDRRTSYPRRVTPHLQVGSMRDDIFAPDTLVMVLFLHCDCPLVSAFSMAASASAATDLPGVFVANLKEGGSIPLGSLTKACDCVPRISFSAAWKSV
jgi:hypothetical protein